MSNETLQRFLERLNSDAAFRERAVANPESAFTAFGLTTAERTAITAGDDDALRRMTGADVTGYFISSSSSIVYTVQPPPHQPGTGTGTGTGTGKEDGTGPRGLAPIG